MQQIDMQVTSPHVELRFHENYKFSCQRCGECCRRPGYFTPDSMEEVARRFDLGKEKFYNEFCELRPGKTVITPKISQDTGYCIFLEWDDDRASCTIQDIKPRNCAYSPLMMKRYKLDDDLNVILNKNSLFALCSCPGTGKGRKHKVRDWVRETGMAKDMTFQIQVLMRIAIDTGIDFETILERKHVKDGALSWQDEYKLRKAVERSYGIRTPEIIVDI